MATVPDSFDFDHHGTALRYGRGRVADLGHLLDDHGHERALVVCGRHVAANDDLQEPIRAALGDRLVGVFDGTTPEKRAESVYDAIDAMADVGADVLVGVGGGSSFDVTRQTSAFAADGRSLDDFRAELAETGAVTPPRPTDALPVVLLPTTLVGADVSTRGSVELASAADSPTGQPVRTSGAVHPLAVVYDPDLFATTPRSAMTGSAMNGFDKGIETPYAADATPISDATAMHGLGLFADGLRHLDDPDGLASAVVGSVLVQFERRTSVVHAVGHGFSRRYDVQQGLVHAAVVPGVLRWLFDRVDGRRRLLARGLGLATEGYSDAAVAEAVVETVTDLRDGLGLPGRLRDLPDVERDDLPAVAAFVVDDPPMARAPPGLDATAEDVEALLESLW
jgi:alcohol dehydrogenase